MVIILRTSHQKRFLYHEPFIPEGPDAPKIPWTKSLPTGEKLGNENECVCSLVQVSQLE